MLTLIIIFILIFILLSIWLFLRIHYIPIIIISLERSQDRRDRLKDILKDIDYKIFNAVDGKNETEYIQKLKEKHVIENTINPGQTGCLLSHITLWENFIQKDKEHVLVLEDDIYINSIFKDFIKTHVKLPDNFDIIFLGHCGESKSDESENVLKYKLHKSVCPRCTHGYIISKQGAKKFLDYFYNNKVDLPIDEMLCRIINEKKLNSYSLYPTIVNQAWQEENVLPIPSTIN
jgi:glycosyl transferase family 25